MDLWMSRAILLKQRTHRLSLHECRSVHLGKHFRTEYNVWGNRDILSSVFSFFPLFPHAFLCSWVTDSFESSAPRKTLNEHFLLLELRLMVRVTKLKHRMARKSFLLTTRRELLNLFTLADYSKFVRVFYSVD